MPSWADDKEDAYEALIMRWLGLDPDFEAVSRRNKKNRGSEGTHRVGIRNHHRFNEKMVSIYMEQPALISLMFSS